MTKLYPIPADNAKLMFRVYAVVAYILAGMAAILVSFITGWNEFFTGCVAGAYVTWNIKALEGKAVENARDNGIGDSVRVYEGRQ